LYIRVRVDCCWEGQGAPFIPTFAVFPLNIEFAAFCGWSTRH
jgi:hypothetical protein